MLGFMMLYFFLGGGGGGQIYVIMKSGYDE